MTDARLLFELGLSTYGLASATGVPANRLLDTIYSGLDRPGAPQYPTTLLRLDHLQVGRFLAFVARETTDPAKAQEFIEAIEVTHSAWLISTSTE